jgi:hypothetical protein
MTPITEIKILKVRLVLTSLELTFDFKNDLLVFESTIYLMELSSFH